MFKESDETRMNFNSYFPILRDPESWPSNKANPEQDLLGILLPLTF